MSPLRQQMIAALQLSGKGERTQQASVREVRLLAQFSHTSPDLISEQELQQYLLHRKNVDHLAPASLRICSSGIRFFSQHVLKRDWSTLSLMRAQTAHRLPALLSAQEVRRLLAAATPSVAPPIDAREVDLGEGTTIDVHRGGPSWHTTAANVAGLPALSVPFATSSEGLPIGVQLIGRANAEDALLAAAELLRPSDDELRWPAVLRR